MDAVNQALLSVRDLSVAFRQGERQLLVVDEEKVLWVVGQALDERVRITPGTARTIRLRSGRSNG